MKIVFGVREYDTYVIFTGLWGFSSMQKCKTAMHCLACRAPEGATDDYLHMAESTCFGTVTRFRMVVIAMFGSLYLRQPTE
jgi:hypothetical protein